MVENFYDIANVNEEFKIQNKFYAQGEKDEKRFGRLRAVSRDSDSKLSNPSDTILVFLPRLFL